MSFYSEMIKPLSSGVINKLGDSKTDKKNLEFLIESVSDPKLWQLKADYADALLRIEMYDMAKRAGASGTDYAKFVRGGSYYKGVLNAIENRFVMQSNADIMSGYKHTQSGDVPSALECFKAAAERFNGEGCFSYGVLLLSDDANNEQSAFWFRVAAQLGNAKGMVNLALCYQNGVGIEHSMPLALVWLARAVLLGEDTAKTELAEIYKYGDGIDTDFKKSYTLSKGTDEEIEAVCNEIIDEYTK